MADAPVRRRPRRRNGARTARSGRRRSSGGPPRSASMEAALAVGAKVSVRRGGITSHTLPDTCSFDALDQLQAARPAEPVRGRRGESRPFGGLARIGEVRGPSCTRARWSSRRRARPPRKASAGPPQLKAGPDTRRGARRRAAAATSATTPNFAASIASSACSTSSGSESLSDAVLRSGERCSPARTRARGVQERRPGVRRHLRGAASAGATAERLSGDPHAAGRRGLALCATCWASAGRRPVFRGGSQASSGRTCRARRKGRWPPTSG